MKVILHSLQYSPRLRYAAELIFSTHLGMELKMEAKTWNEEDIHISYGEAPAPDSAIRIPDSGLLFEKGIRRIDPLVVEEEGLPCFFICTESFKRDTEFGFDLFSLVFYLVSRYEEYMDLPRDRHGRVSAFSSLAFREKFLTIPLVDLWIHRLKEKMEAGTGQKIPLNRQFKMQISLDIDQVFAFRHKSVTHVIGGALKDFFFLRWNTFLARIRYLMNGKDPFDTYDYILENCSKLDPPVYIFLLCRYQKPFDENNLVNHPSFEQLISSLEDSKFTLGIHPSYNAHVSGIFEDELNKIQSLSSKRIYSSRQHFLRLHFPHSYRQLLDYGIREDHSLLYSDHIGFRASTSLPFLWYDLEAELTTDLTIVPYAAMDVSLRYYQGLNPEEAKNQLSEMIRTVELCQGQYGLVWHNSSLGTAYGWTAWKSVFEYCLAKAKD